MSEHPGACQGGMVDFTDRSETDSIHDLVKWEWDYGDRVNHVYNRDANFQHTYLGIGTGLAFETKTGIFNISYAVGKRNDLNFDLRQSKIHIGFVSLF